MLMKSFSASFAYPWRPLQSKALSLVQYRILRLPKSDTLQRQLSDSSLGRPDCHLAPRHADLAANVSQGDLTFARIRAQTCNACDLAHFFFIRDNLSPSRDCRRVFRNEAGKLAMHIAPRADALDNFLSHVATLVEVEGAHLFGFLGKVALANVHAVQRNAGDNALHFQRL